LEEERSLINDKTRGYRMEKGGGFLVGNKLNIHTIYFDKGNSLLYLAI